MYGVILSLKYKQIRQAKLSLWFRHLKFILVKLLDYTKNKASTLHLILAVFLVLDAGGQKRYK